MNSQISLRASFIFDLRFKMIIASLSTVLLHKVFTEDLILMATYFSNIHTFIIAG